MRVSRLFGTTLKETPAEADVASHQLLLRAGYLRPLGSGIFCYLPLAYRALHKIERILQHEMDRIGGQRLDMPVVHPAETWQATGRWQTMGSEMVRFQDRRGSDLCLAMTHEEVVAWLCRSEVSSYRQLPLLVYQLQTKFRDEPRARGGLVRTREFTMKDSYSLDRDVAGLHAQYETHYDAYFHMFARTGLPVVVVASDPGMMGGKVAHEYMYVTPMGEDQLVLCDGCGYAANREVGRFGPTDVDHGTPEPVQKVATPGAKTIAELAAFLGIESHQTAKVVLFTAAFADDRPDILVMAIVRGDQEVNPVAVQGLSGASELRPAHDDEIAAAGVVPGYASAIGLSDADRERVLVVVDALVERSTNLVAGANDEGFHLTGTQCGRDYAADAIGPIALAFDGAPCGQCGAPLRLTRGVEVGNIFQLGTRYTDALEAGYLDENGKAQPIVMGSYGIGVGRVLACVAEHHRDDHGLALPICVAPYEVALVALARKPETREAADALYTALVDAGVEVLYDDRKKVSAGFKFAEADLRGMPLRVVVSDRGVKTGTVELKRRVASWTDGERAPAERRDVPLADAVHEVQAELNALWAELATFEGTMPTWR